MIPLAGVWYPPLSLFPAPLSMTCFRFPRRPSAPAQPPMKVQVVLHPSVLRVSRWKELINLVFKTCIKGGNVKGSKIHSFYFCGYARRCLVPSATVRIHYIRKSGFPLQLSGIFHLTRAEKGITRLKRIFTETRNFCSKKDRLYMVAVFDGNIILMKLLSYRNKLKLPL